MKKILRCRDLGERTCNYLAEGDSVEDVERKMLDHTEEKHSLFLESLDQEEKEHFMQQMEAMAQNKS